MSIICHNCQTPNRDQAIFCKECGQFLSAHCPNCGSELPDGAKYCDICGHRLAAELAPQTTPVITPSRPAPQQPVEKSPPGVLEKYVPAGLRAKLEPARATGGMAGERRVVTMLFCDVKGSTAAAEQLDPEEWADIINGAFEHMIGPVYTYEGTVVRLMGDGILAFFGAPIAHEDDPERALLAGLDIVAGIDGYSREIRERFGLDFHVRVGINTGLVVVGAVGSDLRLEYTALGDAINVAARMEQAAEPGTILVAEDTYKLVSGLFSFEDLGGLDVKGKAQPIRTYRVQARKEVPGSQRGIQGLETPLIGRQEEMAILNEAVNDLALGRGSIVFVQGQAGLGKSRLIKEIIKDGNDKGIFAGRLHLWVHSRIASYESSEAYNLLKKQIRQMLDLAVGPSAEIMEADLKDQIERLPAGQREQDFNVLARLLGLGGDAGDAAALKGEEFKRQLLGAVDEIFRMKTAERPALMIVDDLHWADPASAEVIQHLFQLVDSSPILFICTTRPDRDSASWDLKTNAEKEYPHRYKEINLQPFDDADCNTFLEALLSDGDLSPSIRDLILSRSEGNPFFIEEVVRTYLDEGLLTQNAAGSWQLAEPTADIVVPNNLQGLLSTRIDRLAEDARQVLQMAAVIGHSFQFDVLQRLDSRRQELDQLLTMLQRSDLIAEISRMPERRYVFRSTLMQETVYRSILRKARRDYHRQVAEAILAAYPDQASEHIPVLAHHFYQALDDRALHYNTRAGDIAFELYATKEAVLHYGRALEVGLQIDTEPGQLTYLFERRGRSLELSSQFAEALSSYEEMEKLAGDRADKAMMLSAIVSQTTIYTLGSELGDRDKAEKMALKALELAQSLGDEAAEAKIHWNLLNSYRYVGNEEKAIESGERSLALARKLNLREQEAYTANDLTHAYYASGQLEKSIEVVTEAIKLWRELDNLPMLADSLSTAALGYSLVGDFHKVIEFSEQAYNISQSINNIWGISYSRIAAGPIYFEMGQVEKSIAMMNDSIEKGQVAGFFVARTWGGTNLARVYASLGLKELAFESAVQADRQTKKFLPTYWPLTISALGLVQAIFGEADEARVTYDKLSEADREAISIFFGEYQRNRCLYALLRKDFQDVIKKADNIISTIDKGFKLYAPSAYFLKAKGLLGLGRLEEAGQSLAMAQEWAESLGANWWLWQILAVRADLEKRLKNQEEAGTLAAEARKIVDEIAGEISDEDLRNSFLATVDLQGV